MSVVEQEEANKEAIERLQESLMLVDMLRERDALEERLREVRDLEERLQEVDEMAERLQEVLEEELGKEEVDRLRKEVGDVEQDVQTQAKTITEMVLKNSVQIIETKEDEVDELEDEIKRVFLKGLLPEDEEVEVKQESINEVTDSSLLDDDLREKLYQIETEWKNEVEDTSGFSDTVGTVSAVINQKVERRAIIEESGLRLETDAVLSEDRLGKDETWFQTEIMENIGEGEVTEIRQPADTLEVADTDVWFILSDAGFKPPGKAHHLETILVFQYHHSFLLFFCVLFA